MLGNIFPISCCVLVDVRFCWRNVANVAIWCHTSRLTWVWLMACHLFSAKPSHESLLPSTELDPQENALHGDVIKWKHIPRYWLFVRRIHWSPVNSPHKGQWRGNLMFSLICTRINGWVNNGEAGDLRRNRAHYDVTVMENVVHKLVAILFGLQYVDMNDSLYNPDVQLLNQFHMFWDFSGLPKYCAHILHGPLPPEDS